MIMFWSDRITRQISLEYLRKWKTEVRSWPRWRCYQWHSEFEVHQIRTYNFSVKTVWRCRGLEIWSWSLKTVSIGRKFNEQYQRGRFDIFCNVNVFDQRSDTETANSSTRLSNNTLVWLFFSFFFNLYIFICFSISLFLAGNAGRLTWVRRSSRKSSATHSYQCVYHLRVSRHW